MANLYLRIPLEAPTKLMFKKSKGCYYLILEYNSFIFFLSKETCFDPLANMPNLRSLINWATTLGQRPPTYLEATSPDAPNLSTFPFYGYTFPLLTDSPPYDTTTICWKDGEFNILQSSTTKPWPSGGSYSILCRINYFYSDRNTRSTQN